MMKTPTLFCAALLLTASASGETSLVEAGRLIHLRAVEEGLNPVDTYFRVEVIEAIAIFQSQHERDKEVPFQVRIMTRMMSSGSSMSYTLHYASREKSEKAAAALLKVISGEAKETASKEPANQGDIVIHVLEDGRLEAKGGMVEEVDLAQSLKDIATLHPDQQVIIHTDDKTKYNDVTRVMELCQKAGITKVSFATAKERDVESKPSGGDKLEK